MTAVAFQPAFDVFHTSFRFLRLRRIMAADLPWHYHQLRIADFYLQFFFRIEDVRLSQRQRWIKRAAVSQSSKRYESQPDDRLVFDRMRPMQDAALATLVSKGFFQLDSPGEDYVLDSGKPDPAEIGSRIDALNLEQHEIMEALSQLVTEYGLLGPDGIKARTDLLEYRYDAV